MPEVAPNKPLPVSQARAGDPAAWDTLFQRYQLPLYVYVFELVRDEQEAELVKSPIHLPTNKELSCPTISSSDF
jgi:RNA polymerase sigma-70 factor (ECF subfamily)